MVTNNFKRLVVNTSKKTRPASFQKTKTGKEFKRFTLSTLISWPRGWLYHKRQKFHYTLLYLFNPLYLFKIFKTFLNVAKAVLFRFLFTVKTVLLKTCSLTWKGSQTYIFNVSNATWMKKHLILIQHK